jgi:hypothetical protein
MRRAPRVRARGKRLARIALGASLALVSVSGAVALAGSSRVASDSGCGGVVSAGPSDWHRGYRAPLAIGDSTMLLALPDLSREGFAVNAHGCRQYPEALSLLRSLRDAHALPRVVVIALGANGEISDSDIEAALATLGRDRLLVLVTPRELGGRAGSDAALVRAEGRRHPRRVRVLDWVAYSAGHAGWFEPDGLHLSLDGSAALARLIGRVRPLAAPPRSLRAPRCSSSQLGPAMALAGVSLAPVGGALVVPASSSRLRLKLVNANPFPVAGLVSLSEAVAGSRKVDARCISAPAGGRATFELTLDAVALAELEIRQRYRVRLVLSLTAAAGYAGTIASTYSIEQTPSSRARSTG